MVQALSGDNERSGHTEARFTERPFQVLHIDDNPAIGELIQTYLEEAVDREEFSVTIANSVDEAKQQLTTQTVDCIVCDQQMPETTGLEFLREIRAEDPHTPFILFTNKGSAGMVETAINAGATDYVRKGTNHEQYEVLANRIANAIKQERGRIARTQLNETTAVVSKLYSVLHETDLSVDEKFDRVLEIGTEELGYPIGYLTELSGDSLEIISAVGDNEVIQEHLTVPLRATFCEQTIKSAEPMVLSDAARDERWSDSVAFEQSGLRCYVGAPIIVDGEVYGSLCFASEQPRDQTTVEDDELTVKTLAQWVGYEIDRDNYEQELKRQIDRLEEFTGVVAHDLRNPLTVAKGRIEMVGREYDSENVASVSRALDRMDSIIEDTLTLARQGQTVDTDEIEAVDIESVITHCSELIETDDVEVRLVDSFSPQADRNRLYRLVENLIRNAAEHSETPVTVRIGTISQMFTTTRVDTDGTFGFYIEDDGPGVPEDKRQTVFEPGETTNPQGTGFGLPIVKRIAEAHGWEVTLTESFDGGARFEFTNIR